MSKFIASLVAATMLVPAAARAEGTIEVLHHWVSQSEVDALNVIRKDLETKGFQWKDSAVGGMSGANAQQALRSRLTSGDPPGAMQFLGWEGPQWAEQGVVRDLNDLAKEGGWREALPPQLLTFVTSGDAFIAAPINMHRQNWVWANKKIFDEAGIAPPKTWEELIAAGKKLKEKGVTPVAMGDEAWQIGIIFDALLSDLNGPEFYKKVAIDLDPAALNSPEMTKVFDTLREVRGLVDDNFVGRDWAVATGMVINGEAAMQFMGDWAKGEFLAKGLKPNADFYCFATPAKVSSFQYVIDSFGMFTVKDETVQKAQVALAETIMDPKVQKGFNLIKGSIPARTDVSVDDFDECAKRGFNERAEAIKAGSMLGAMTHGFAAKPEFASVFGDVAAQFFVGNMSSEDAVKMLVEGIDNAR
ncbi:MULTISPECIES: ABC transporter substrate-binding protein [Sinorhizobium]|uniref:ABC transporter substrate-binding protein n=1 Tax=Sinorhizobium TaxID=28105 RepID=UPI000BE81FFF|nr:MULTISPECIES: ABC transporter substrate-binding protein [Sinorhizobium]PDT51228.1 sugar ABC transporter substrate-binding protein [Sinorhizobium sp. NG07B]POH25883.1 sugar ABC transporter substrate-binding protein [Sinorhizobium americanum]